MLGFCAGLDGGGTCAPKEYVRLLLAVYINMACRLMHVCRRATFGYDYGPQIMQPLPKILILFPAGTPPLLPTFIPKTSQAQLHPRC